MGFWKNLGNKILKHMEEVNESNKALAPANNTFGTMLQMNEYAAEERLKREAKTLSEDEWANLMNVLDANARFHTGDRQKRAALLAKLGQTLRPEKKP